MTTLQPTSTGADTAQFLDDRQIEYDLKVINLSDIDIETSKHNQARFLPLHEETVFTYGAAMEQGDVFPPIVVNNQKGKYLVLDGNHRVAAAGLAGYTQTTAYVTKNLSKAQAELVTFEANARHGLPTSIEERVQQGLYLVNIGNKAASVARALSIPENRLHKAVQTNRAASRLTTLGVDSKKFSQSSIARFGSIASNTVLAPVAQIAVKANLSHSEISEIVSAINAEHDGETAQMKVVEKFRGRYAPRMRSTAGGKLALPENVVLVNRLSKIVHKIDGSLLAVQMTKMDTEESDQLRREVYETIATLVSISEKFKNAVA